MRERVVRLVTVLALVGAPLALRAPPLAAQRAVQPAPQVTPEERLRLEQQFRQRLAKVVRRRLGLTDNQFRQLIATNQRYEGQRRALVQEETELLRGIRAEQLSPRPNQQRVSELLDRRLQLEQQRLSITQQEQRELGTFLTPVQRAQYTALQEQVRRRLQEMRRRQLEGTGTPPQ